ncbi:MAG: hypothetical protein H6739_25450 [Alphaproteobacteria bacterium]|nr:hypothetical protein [Alphaproteobacteria bacterium]
MTHPAPSLSLSLLRGLGLAALLVVGCTSKGDDGFAPVTDRSPSDDTAINTDDTAPDDTAPDDTGPADDTGETGGGSSANLDDEGDVYPIGPGEEEVSLVDISGDSNRDQDFFLIAINGTNSDGGFRLLYSPAATSGAGGPPPPQATRHPTSPLDQRIRQRLAQRHRPQGFAPPPPYDQTDIGIAREEFNVRDHFTQDESITPVTSRLWAVGEYVAIWVDDEVPIDWDYDCDGVIDEPARYNAYGFNNCDLQTVADIVDNNIIVNIRDLFGQESDINGDGKVSVVITPLLNTIPLTSEDEDDWPQVVSYADPVSDLNEFNFQSNPGSDEQEVIYVFAPDPYGFFNPYFTTTVSEYASMELAAEIARSFLKLVLYNTHVLEYEAPTDSGSEVVESAGQPEETWLTEVLGSIAADYCGFGAVYYADAWRYLDAPYLYTLTSFDENSIFSADSRGAQYLYGRWLVDNMGTDFLAQLAQTEYVGVDNIEDVTGSEMEDLVRRWQVALLATGVTDSSGVELVDPNDFPQYDVAGTITAPTTAPTTPAAGIFYGANGHQRGFNVRGVNQWIEGGTTASPSENTTQRVVANGPDFHTYVPGLEFYGYGAGGYGAHTVRLTRLEYEAAALEIQSNVNSDDGGFFGAVVRWIDPTRIDNAVDDIYSPLDVNAVVLPSLPSDGSEIYAFGDIGPNATTRVLAGAEEEESETTGASVADTDRWLLDLTDRATNQVIQVAIWLDRKFINTSGQVGPENPWIAIVEEDDLPTPTVASTNSRTCSTSTNDWEYPNLMIDYVFDQVFLLTTPFESATGDELDSGFDPCGVYVGPLDCADDWDRDGVPDTDEPSPTNFVQQVLVEQCQDNGGTLPSDYYTTDWIDIDSVDEDDLPSFSVVYNVGGQSGEAGEEALLVVTLLGGNRYIVVVSGGEQEGPYELSFKQLN